MNLKILLLPGDGIGIEVTDAAVAVLKAVANKFGHTLELSEGLLGAVAIHKTGSPFPKETERLALEARAKMEEFVARRTKMAETKIAQAEAQAVADVRAAAAEAAVTAAEKILTQSVKGDVADKLIAQGIGDVKAKLN